MAVTKIHSIRSTLSKAIAYIMKPEKTEQGRLIETFCCAPFQANLIAEDFMETRSMGTGRGDVLAKHMIQSFLPDEITPDEAMEIGRKLVKSFLRKGKIAGNQ